MVAHGTDGDVLPVIRIGRELSKRGHRVALLSHARYSRHARGGGMRFVAVDTVAADQASQTDPRADLNNLGERRDLRGVREYYELHGFFAQLRFECRALRRLYAEGDTVLIGLALSSLSVLTAGEWLSAPVACLSASPFHLSVLDRAAAEYAEIFGEGLDAVREEMGLAAIGDWPAWLGRARTGVGTWPHWFDACGESAGSGVRLTGFVLADEDPVKSEPSPETVGGDAVLIAGSSGQLTSSAFYRAAIAATVRLGRPAVVVSRSRDLLPDRLPPGVRWFPRLAFRDVIPRVAAVVHHGGIGTAVRALVSGTPQLLLASGFDRPDNARRLTACGLAEWLPESDWHADQAAAKLYTVLRRGRVELPPGAGPVDAVQAAADVIERVSP